MKIITTKDFLDEVLKEEIAFLIIMN